MSQRTDSSAYRQELRRAQADAQNAELEANIAKLRNILKDALTRDTYIELEKLKTTPRIEPFKKEKPRRGNYLPTAPAGMSKMLPWKKREYEQLLAEGENRYERAERKYQGARADHEMRMNVRRNNAIEHNRKIASLQERFSAGESKAVEIYFTRVLQSGSYPEAIPQKSQLVYTANTRQLAIERDLPTFEAVPDAKAYRYVKARDEITQTALAQSQRKQLYRSVIAQIPLRTIHEIYTADRTEKIDTVVFCGFVNKVHPGTGKPRRFCLISVSTTRHQFLDLNLELIDPLECVKYLNGRISRKPEDLVTVDPLEVIGDTKTPPSLSQTVTVEYKPRRADEIYHRVNMPVPEPAPQDIPIPARPQNDGFRASFSPKGILFIEQAREYVDRTETQAEPVPFMQYWPTYESMDAAQLRWYFYWRTQLRQGNLLPTDLSYLFVHIYEVINMIGFDSAGEAFTHLDAFWRTYRQLQPKLDRYLPDWIADFIVLHQLAPNALDWYSEVGKVTDVTDPNFALEAWVNSGDSFEALPDGTLFALAKYNPTKSKFYKQFSELTDLHRGYKRALVAIDEAARKEQGKTLFQLHQPERRQVIRRAPFASAVHDYPAIAIEIAATHAWTEVEPLSAALNSIIKHADNVLRGQAGYRYRVRGIQLTEASKSLIEKALRSEAPRREVSIDHSEIAQLAEESEALRERLLADAETLSEPPQPEETLADEQLLAAASWVPEVPKERPAPIEVPAKPTAKTAAIDWSRVGGRRQARAMLRLSRFTAFAGRVATNHVGPGTQQQPPVDEIVETATSGMGGGSDSGIKPAASGFLHRPEDTPAELLTDLAEVAHIMGASDERRSKLIGVIMADSWECPADVIESAFPGEFISVIIDEINGIALDEIGDTLIIEEDGLCIVQDEYRDEVEYILQHPEYLEK